MIANEGSGNLTMKDVFHRLAYREINPKARRRYFLTNILNRFHEKKISRQDYSPELRPLSWNSMYLNKQLHA